MYFTLTPTLVVAFSQSQRGQVIAVACVNWTKTQRAHYVFRGVIKCSDLLRYSLSFAKKR